MDVFDSFRSLRRLPLPPPTGPEPVPPVKRTRRSRRRHRAQMRVTGWARLRALERLGSAVADEVARVAVRQGFFRRMLDGNPWFASAAAGHPLTLTRAEIEGGPDSGSEGLRKLEDARILEELRRLKL